MERTCRICTQIKPIYAKELCKNCYSAEWKKRNPDTNSRYVKNHRENHPGYAADGLRRLAQFKEKIPIKILEDAGINTTFMRGQLEEHRKQKRANIPKP